MSETSDPVLKLHGDPPAASQPEGVEGKDQLARIAVERTRMPMVVTDARQPDYPVVLANRAFLELTGYGADEVIGRNCRFLQGEGTSPDAIQAIRDAVADEREIEVELLNYRKDGSGFWNQLGLVPVHGDDGTLLYYFGSQIDVTELRRVQELEASEHRLLAEVDHRARNVLAVVNGIVRLSRADDPERYAAAIQNRVQALARAHTLLADRGWREVALEEVVRDQVEPFAGGRATVSGPQVMISALAVQPLALVFHELAVNASTHGALSRPEGALRISWTEGAAYGAFELRWEETGVRAPVIGHRQGGGTTMVKGLIEWQLGGTLSREWKESGLVVTIALPGALEGVQRESSG
jgi:PAS domain S-box-containing protein